MFENMSVIEIIQMLLPLLIIQFTLIIIAIYQILKHGVRNLSKGLWIVIVIIINLLGPIAYFMFGRKRDYDD